MKAFVEIQKWLGAMIAQPLQDNDELPLLSPFGEETSQEAAKYIAPSPTLSPSQRVQIYHRQYWWRLIKCLESNFPMLTRLFGYTPFERKIAVPYLTTHPPNHWALCKLGDTLSQWIDENYFEEDKYLVRSAASIDWAAGEAFWIKSLPIADFEKFSHEVILTHYLILQPYVYLFKLEGDFFTFRDEFLKNDPEYYNSNHFPDMNYGNYHFVLYRTPKNVVSWKQLSQAEYWMLAQFKRGTTIEKACADLEAQGGEILEEALSQIPFWFKQWTVLKWFGSFSSSSL